MTQLAVPVSVPRFLPSAHLFQNTVAGQQQQQQQQSFDLLVIGGGSGGLACAKEGQVLKLSGLSGHVMWPWEDHPPGLAVCTCENVYCVAQPPAAITEFSASVGKKLIKGAMEYGVTSDDIFWLKESPGKTSMLCSAAGVLSRGVLSSDGFPTNDGVPSGDVANGGVGRQVKRLIILYQ
ncbi:thioredoxin reductase 2 [Cricetulus griseus]|uniref:Thioredoxin reductase 2 n=1 Tax=Cricetulus griseus TaxID=10029 RepID=A0A061I925_CRIGR|nr:thioredoxin reductase 2 [Cricetulus griseus]